MKTGIFKIFGVIGLILLLGAGYSFYSAKQFQSASIETTGVVIDLVGDDTVAPVVRYETASGESFTMKSSVSSNPPAFEIGESVSVFYKEDNPQDARINSFLNNHLLALILGVMGLIFFLIGVVPGIIIARGKSNTASLMAQGHQVKAAYRRVEQNTMLQINGENPFRIVCQWKNPSDNKLFIFYSQNLWFDPEPYINRELIDVYVRPDNFKKYAMDTSFLPELA